MKYVIGLTFSALVIATLVSCASTGDGNIAMREPAPVSFTPVMTQAAAGDVLEKWEDRLQGLKFISIETNDRERHNLVEKKISRLEDKLEDARAKFLDMKFATAQDKQKHLDKLNGIFNESSQIYNASLAE